MRIIVLFLFSLFAATAFADSCEEMRQDLFALEYKIQNSSLKACKDASSGEICCRKGDPQSCKTKQELEKDYNEAMAKLIIAEGLASIGMSIESNNNALNDLSNDDINKATTYLEDLGQSLNQANLIYLALEFEGNTTLFSDYNGSKPYEIKDHLKAKCSSPLFDKMKVCTELKNLAKNTPSKHEEFLKTLSGFLNSDKQVTNSDAERKPRYAGYQNKLRVLVGGKNLTPAEFKNDPHYQNLLLLEAKISALAEKRKLNQPTEELGREILNLAKSVDEISVNYKNESTQTPEVTSYFKQKFDSVLNQLDLPSLLLEGGIKDNFQNTSKKLSNEVERHKMTLNKQIGQAIKGLKDERSGGEKVSSICSHNYDISCLKKLCGDDGTTPVEHCENFEQFGLDTIYQKLKSLNEHQGAKNILDQASACLESKKNLLDKRNCLMNIPRGSETNISRLRENLKNAQKGIHYVNSGQPFKGLNLQKGMALNAINSNYCRKKNDHIRISGSKTDCGQDNILGLDYEVLDLGLAGEKAMIALNTQTIKRFLQGAAPESDIKKYRAELNSACKKGKVEMPAICHYYLDEAAWETKISQEREARKNEVIIEDYEEVPGESLDYATAFKVAGGVFAQNAMPLTMAWIETDYVKTQTRMQINSIKAYDEAYMKNLEAYRAYIDNPYELPYQVSNWGYPQTGFTYNNYSSFQANSSHTNRLYNSHDGMNFDFNPIPVTSSRMPSGITPVTPSSANPSSGANGQNNVFEFKF